MWLADWGPILLSYEKCVGFSVSDTTCRLVFQFNVKFRSGYNDKYRGPWVIDDATGHCKGNPALAANVQDLIRSLHKSKDISNRKHAKAISIEDMRKSYEKAISILGPNFDNHRIYRKHIDTDPEARKAWLECIKALFMLVFSVTAFTVWSRCVDFLTFSLCFL